MTESFDKKREPTPHAAAAKQIRTKLKETFPGLKFSVRSHRFAGGSSVTVVCPAEGLHPDDLSRVKTLAERHQYGHFNGMTDSYEMSNSRDDIPQVMFVHVEVARD